LAERDPKAVELFENMEQVKKEAAEFMEDPRRLAVLRTERKGIPCTYFAPGATRRCIRFDSGGNGRAYFLCLADYVCRHETDSATTWGLLRGDGRRRNSGRSEKAKNEGYYFKSHGPAGRWQSRRRSVRGMAAPAYPGGLGLPRSTGKSPWRSDPSRYHGKRYSFGYPACPNLEDQAGIWKLLKPEEIGVQLTEGFMMDPEASVSALVFHHPDCTYFSVGGCRRKLSVDSSASKSG